MVKLIPPNIENTNASDAEKKVFGLLSLIEMPDAVVLHSLTLPKHKTKIYGEIDFVIVCELGVACIEVKGGRIKRENGVWSVTDRYSEVHVLKEPPFQQVSGNMLSLGQILRDRYSENPQMRNMTLASGVFFPDIVFTDRSCETVPEILFDKSKNDVTEFIRGIFNYWDQRSRSSQRRVRLTRTNIKSIVNYLRMDFDCGALLATQLNNLDEHLTQLTMQQISVIAGLRQNPRLLINGDAGTGKTMLAIKFAQDRATEGKKTLFLVFTKNLMNAVKRHIGEDENLRIINIHALFDQIVSGSTPQNVDKSDQHTYFQEVMPQIFIDYMKSLPPDELEKLQYDTLIVDEGQDIVTPKYLETLNILVKGGMKAGNWAILYDDKQNIFIHNEDIYQKGLEILESYQCVKYLLSVNCRNALQIGNFFCRECGISETDFLCRKSGEVKFLSYSDENGYKKVIKETLKELKREGVDARDICILSPKKLEGSGFGQLGIPVTKIESKDSATPDLPVFATIQGFKGLDSKIIILCDLDAINDEKYKQYMYIAASRARTLLYVVGSAEYFKKHPAE